MARRSISKSKETQSQKAALSILLPLSILVVYILLRVLPDGSIPGSYLRLAAGSEVLHKPWTLLTYAWVHDSPHTLLPSLLILVMISALLHLRGITVTRMVMIFLAGTTMGALFFWSFMWLQGNETTLSGASAGTTAIVTFGILTTTKWRSIWRWIALVGLLIADYLTLSNDNTYGFIAHIGGYFTGIALALYHCHKVYKNNQLQERYKKKQQHKILQQIRQSGYTSLSREERLLLLEESEQTNREKVIK